MPIIRLALFVLPLAIAPALACGSEADEPGSASPAGLTVPPAATGSPTPGATPLATPETLPPPLTLDDVFPPRDLSQYRLDPSRIRTIIATGDVIPARFTDVIIRQRGDDFLYPAEHVAEITSRGDVTVTSLDTPIIDGCPYHAEGFVFCARPGIMAALEALGVDVAAMETNHVRDYGAAGYQETIGRLEASGIRWADRNNPVTIDVRGMKFGFLAYNGVGETFDRQKIVAQVRELRPRVDVLAVSMQWGAEYVHVPAAAPGVAPDDPMEMARLLADEGADLIIGNHPHWIQGVEIINGTFVTYAHGNFIYDQMWSYETRAGIIGKYTFYDGQLIGVEFIPTVIHDYAQPIPAQGEERQAILDTLHRASREIAERAALYR
jgi:poly-gamma-glutamate synthesis protein (capsule biosynthesis protein)